MEKIDLDRLHYVVQHRPAGRKAGRTFARCCELAGHVALGVPAIVCQTTLQRDVDYLVPMIKRVFDEMGLPLERVAHDRLKSEESQIMFVPEYRFDDYCRAREFVHVPMRHWD